MLEKRLQAYNKGRDPIYLALKYQAMRQSAFRFFRGTAHLFYEDLPPDNALLDSPKSYICGDLHLENLGSFKGDNGVAYFDLNDFDEAALAPCLLDVARFACSIHVGSEDLGLDPAGARSLAGSFIDSFVETLRKGYVRSLERETATGVIKQFLRQVENRTNAQFLSSRVTFQGGKPRILVDKKRYFPLKEDRKKAIMKTFVRSPLYKSDPEFFSVLDAAFRVAGTGSLGMERYVLLVEGKKGKSGYSLVDIKEAQAPSLLLRHRFRQPAWASQAERIIEIQKRVTAVPPALLSPLEIGGKHFIVKQLQPQEDKLNLLHLKARIKRCQQFAGAVGRLAAWGNLRGGGREGSATADTLIAFAGRSSSWKPQVAAYAAHYAAIVRRDYAEFCRVFDAGHLKLHRP